jgi:D-alanine-D-alanine ligase-like ATP-grasp enzyme
MVMQLKQQLQQLKSERDQAVHMLGDKDKDRAIDREALQNEREKLMRDYEAKMTKILYDFEAKYRRDDTEYLLDPELPAGVEDAIRRHARAAWTRLGLRDVARMDFMLDARGPWFLEANTMPGFTDHSLVPKAARHAGISMEMLVRGMAERALARGATATLAS